MDYFEQIEAYLNNTLSESERLTFEEAMKSDPKLKQAVEDHSIAMDVVGSILEDEVRKVIEEEELIINNEQLIINNGGEDEGLIINNEQLIIDNGGKDEELIINNEQLIIDNGGEDEELIINNEQLIIDNEGKDEELIINNEQLIIDNEGDKEEESEKSGGGVLPISGDSKEDSVSIKRINWMRWVAAAGLMFVLGWWGMGGLGNSINIENEIYSKYTPLPTLGAKSNAKLISRQDSALHFYDIRDFEKSRMLFESLKSENSNDTINIYLANLYFLNKDFEQTKKMLDLIPEITEITSGKKELQFFILLVDKDIEGAKSILNTMNAKEQNRLSPLLEH